MAWDIEYRFSVGSLITCPELISTRCRCTTDLALHITWPDPGVFETSGCTFIHRCVPALRTCEQFFSTRLLTPN